MCDIWTEKLIVFYEILSITSLTSCFLFNLGRLQWLNITPDLIRQRHLLARAPSRGYASRGQLSWLTWFYIVCYGEPEGSRKNEQNERRGTTSRTTYWKELKNLDQRFEVTYAIYLNRHGKPHQCLQTGWTMLQLSTVAVLADQSAELAYLSHYK